jgi:hypothetical protein
MQYSRARTWHDAQLLEALREQRGALAAGALPQRLRVKDGRTQVLREEGGRGGSGGDGAGGTACTATQTELRAARKVAQ